MIALSFDRELVFLAFYVFDIFIEYIMQETSHQLISDSFPFAPWVEGILFPFTPATVSFHLYFGGQKNLLSSKETKEFFP